MARPLRVDIPGAVSHVTARANGRGRLFGTDECRERLLAGFGAVVERYSWLCHAYVLMDTHFHLLVETPLPNRAASL